MKYKLPLTEACTGEGEGKLSRVLLCTGNYAKTPYFVERAYSNVYSAEELCYCLTQNAYLLGREIVDREMADWLKTECGLKELSDTLHKILSDDCTAGEYIVAILEYVGYGNIEDINIVTDILQNSGGENIYARRKARADYLAEGKKYVLALKNYDSLLEELPEAEQEIRAGVLHNRGVTYAELFQFRHAALSFIKAYEYNGDNTSYINYLAACRMYMEETEYVDFITKQAQDYEISLKVEQLMEDAVRQFAGTDIRACKERDSSVSYYEEIERLTDELKEQYRKNTSE